MKLGLTTGGGDCPGLNAAIRAVVKAGQQFGHTIYGIEKSLSGLLDHGKNLRLLTSKDVAGILDRGGTILGTANQGNPFDASKAGQANLNKFLKHWKQSKLDGLIVIGGDGTQRIAKLLHNLGIKVIGIPKTIDNDFAATELSIGFMTAVDVVTQAVSRLHSTAEAHSRLMVVEVMGRHAGFISLQSAIASGAHVVLLPELPYSYSAIVKKILERQKRGRHFSVIVVAEGAYEKGKKPLFRSSATGTINLGGIADEVARQLHKRTSIDARVTVLGHLQRGGSPCTGDLILASTLSVEAIMLASQKQFGRVVCIQNGKVQSIAYEDIPKDGTTSINLKDPMLQYAEALGINLGR